MATARKRNYNSTLKIQNIAFIKMPFVFKRSILILTFCNKLFCVILVFLKFTPYVSLFSLFQKMLEIILRLLL